MQREVLDYLAPAHGQVFVDGTVGGGGHALAIADRLGESGMLICVDQDPRMIELARARVRHARVIWAEASFTDLRTVLDEWNVQNVDGIVLDLGISSDQVDNPDRGFSFMRSGPLDMRMNPDVGESARSLVNRMSAQELADIFYRYGEERHSRRIARAIVETRRTKPIDTTGELAEIVRRSLPGGRAWQRIDPATRVFQALRIAVNDELGVLERGLMALPDCLKPGGRAVVISFHSLEDRIVKNVFRQDNWERLTRKPVVPIDAEIKANPRARSAKLRAAKLRPPT
jgi:16S rRNA (cytosine1402-N4)-methyltransferase